MTMKRQPILSIGERDGNHVAIEPTGKVVSGWRTAHVSVRCGAWNGHFTGQFLHGELSKFGKEIEYLEDHAKDRVEFQAVEHYLHVILSKAGHGRVRVEGEARERLGSQTVLGFEFEIEWSSLAELSRALVEADSAE